VGDLRFRLLLTHILVTGLVLVLMGVSLLLFLFRNPVFQNLSYGRLQDILYQTQGLNLRPFSASDLSTAQRLSEQLDQRFRARFVVLSPAGELLLDSRPQAALLATDGFPQASLDQRVLRGEARDADGVRWSWAGIRLTSGRILIAATPAPLLLFLRIFGGDVFIPLLQVALVGLVVSVLLAFIISRSIAAPLQRMAEAAEAVAGGDYGQTLPLDGPLEVRSVASAFNNMLQQVKDSQQSQRDFVANVSHDLKTPLTSIQGFAQAILDGTAANEPEREHAAQVIFDESERLHRLVENLLDLARIDAGQIQFAREPVDLTRLLQAIAERLKVVAMDAGVRLHVDLPDAMRVMGDGDRLAQVFTNLLDNAVKHTPAGGQVRLHCESAAGWVSIHVDDNGEGIPEEDLSRIFERFYQVDKARQSGAGRGVGLGLAISRQIIIAHGGKLVAQSKLGQGSRFSVQLPVVLPDEPTLVQSHDLSNPMEKD